MTNPKTQRFLEVFHKAEKHYSQSSKRLAAERWSQPWQTLIATILSARNRDEVTIPVFEEFIKKFKTLEKIAKAKPTEIKKALKKINFYNNKSKNVQATAKILHEKYNDQPPKSLEELIELPGVGRKTANLFLSEIHGQDTITVDTHVHRIANVFKLVNTKTPDETELALQKVVPKEYWSKINRVFVLWGKEVPGYDKEKLLNHLDN
jgi:endonuclease III